MFFRIAEPYQYASAYAIDVLHKEYLLVSFRYVALIDADGICPERSVLACVAQPTKSRFQVGTHLDTFPFEDNMSGCGTFSPCV
jgi:hypothetical protein